MTVTDSPKKRKRTSSAGRGRKISIQIGRQKLINEDINKMEIRDVFDAKLGLTEGVDAYVKAHHQLLKEEEDDAWDRDVRPRATSRSKSKFEMTEKTAALIIHAVREYERRVTFGNLPSEAIPGPETLDMGGQFLTNKKRMETESKLFDIAKLVPKGALLHLHFNAELDPERLLEQARTMKDHMYIRSIQPLVTTEDLDKTEMVFNVLDPEEVDPEVDIFSPDYPGTATNWRQENMKAKIWMKWSDFQTRFTEKFPKQREQQRDPILPEEPLRGCCADPGLIDLNAAENWLKSKMILSPDEAYGYNQTVNG
jgi:adenosine deaminase CECR1